VVAIDSPVADRYRVRRPLRPGLIARRPFLKPGA
jgi:hypothetical protein